MKKIALIIIFLFIHVVVYSQSYSELGNDVCNNLQTVKIDSKNKSELQQIMGSAMQKAMIEKESVVKKIMLQIRNKMPNASESEIQEQFANGFSVYLIKNCPNCTHMAQKIYIEDCPDYECLQLISNDICNLMEKNKGKSSTELLDIADNNTINFINKYDKQVKIHYKDGYLDMKLMSDLNLYLMSHCEKYFISSIEKTYQKNRYENKY